MSSELHKISTEVYTACGVSEEDASRMASVFELCFKAIKRMDEEASQQALAGKEHNQNVSNA